MKENKEQDEVKPVESLVKISDENVPDSIIIDEKPTNTISDLSNTFPIQSRDSMHPKFINGNVAMLATGNLPYYGEFNLFLNFHQAKIGTCGVNVSSKGMNFYWDAAFVDSLLQEEANFILIHEDMHLLFDHIKRSVGYDQKLANIAQDMIINQTIVDEIMKSNSASLKNFLLIPKFHEEFIKLPNGEEYLDENGNKVPNPNYNHNSALFIPKDYPGEYFFEDVYSWLVKELDKFKNRKNKNNQKGQNPSQGDGQNPSQEEGDRQEKGDGQGVGESQNEPKQGKGGGKGKGKSDDKSDQKGNGGCGENGDEEPYGNYGKGDLEMSHLDNIFENLEQTKGQTMDRHLLDEVPEEIRKEIVKDIMNNLKERGLESADMQTVLNRLRKSKKDYLKEIKRAITNDLFGSTKFKTISRPNRRGIDGLKGRRKYKNEINAILDTSGSMGGEFEKVLSYIFQNDVQINMIQCDAKIQDVLLIKNKRELEMMKISGLGGTEIQPAIDFVASNKVLNKLNTIILTDGYTDSLNFSMIKGKSIILSTAQKCTITKSNGRLKQFIIDKN